MIIRKENTEDFTTIYDLVKTAFKTAKVSDGKEQDFVNQLRSSGKYVPGLALVAVEDEKITGHIMLSKFFVHNGADKFESLYVAPLSVALEYRKRGIGAALLKESFRLAVEMGYKRVFLVGDPVYYSRFGFQSTVNYGIKNSNDIPDEFVMGCELVKDGMKDITGTIDFFE